jgi:GAF domain-containing protein
MTQPQPPVPPVPPQPLLRELARVAQALATGTRPSSLHALVEEVTTVARAVFGAVGCSLALLSEDGTELVFTTVAGGSEETISGLRLPAGTGIAGWVAMTGQPLAVADVNQDARFASDVAETAGYQPRSILACPVATEDLLLGVIEVLDRDPHRVAAADDLQLLGLFARQAAVALEAAQQFDRLGRILLTALADSAETTDDLATTLRAAAETADAETDHGLTSAAAAFAALANSGEREQRLATDILHAVATYADAARSSPWA